MNPRALFGQACRDCLREAGGREDIHRVVVCARARLAPDVLEQLHVGALISVARDAMRDKGDLPWAVSINNSGTYAVRSTLTVSERRSLIAGYMKKAGEFERRAYELADETLQLFPDEPYIDPAQFRQEAASA